MTRRAARRALLAGAASTVAAALVALPARARAQEAWPGPLFDAHLHYNVEAFEPYPVRTVFGLFKASGVRAILANSRPNGGTRALADARDDARGAGVTVVPFVRLYRDRADYQGWPDDPSIHAMVLAELAAGTAVGPYRGLGEFHLYDSRRADAPVAKQLMQLAAQRDLVVLAHCDDDAVERLLAHAPKARLVWAHTGIGGVPIARVRELLGRHAGLVGELSYRPGLTAADGGLAQDWKALLQEQPRRFAVGSDTWVNARWADYGGLMSGARRWLGDLPPGAAEAIGWGNAAGLFGLAKPA